MAALLEALFGESAHTGVRYALLVLFGLVGLEAVARGLLKLLQLVLLGPTSLGGYTIALLGLPFPTFWGVVVMLVELIGGILLLAGVVWEVTNRWGGGRAP